MNQHAERDENAADRVLLGLRISWVLYAMILFAATHVPLPMPVANVVSFFDKIIHASAFFVLGMLTFLSLCWGKRWQTPSVGLLIGLILFAGLDEYLQQFVNRQTDVGDWISDTAGILLAYAVMRVLARRQSATVTMCGPARALQDSL